MKILLYQPYYDMKGHFKEYIDEYAKILRLNGLESATLKGVHEGKRQQFFSGDKDNQIFYYRIKSYKSFERCRLIINLFGGIKLLKILKAQKFSTIYFIDSELTIITPLLLFHLIKRRLQNRKYTMIYTQHSPKFFVPFRENRKRWLYYRILYLVIFLLKLIVDFKMVAYGESSKQKIIQFFKLKEKDVCANNYGAKTYTKKVDKCTARDRLGISVDKTVFLYFGLIRRDKGILRHLETISKLKDNNLHILLAGDPYHYTEEVIRETISKLSLNDKCTFIPGYVENDEIEVFFSSTDFLILPYDYTNLSSSGPLNIGLQFEVIPIVTDAGERAEIVRTHELGFVYDYYNEAEALDVLQKAVDLTTNEIYEIKHRINNYVKRVNCENGCSKVISQFFASKIN